MGISLTVQRKCLPGCVFPLIPLANCGERFRPGTDPGSNENTSMLSPRVFLCKLAMQPKKRDPAYGFQMPCILVRYLPLEHQVVII